MQMDLLRKAEQKFGRFAIRRLTLFIIATYVAGYILLMMGRANGSYSTTQSLIALSPSLILRGQVWRLVSWWLIPPGTLDIFTIIMLYFYYQIGTTLEKVWGDFLYNLYIFFGLLMTVVGSFLLLAITGIDYGAMFSTYYVSLSIFLGFAMTFPNQKVLFMFLIPVKMKWLAYFDLAYLAYSIYQYARIGYALPVIVMVASSLASTILFFVLTRTRFHRKNATQKNFQRQMRGFDSRRNGAGARGFGSRGSSAKTVGTTGEKIDRTTFAAGNGPVTRHRCAVCGRTELDAPDLEFRFCSKCNGNYEYCEEHLYTHKHVQ